MSSIIPSSFQQDLEETEVDPKTGERIKVPFILTLMVASSFGNGFWKEVEMRTMRSYSRQRNE